LPDRGQNFLHSKFYCEYFNGILDNETGAFLLQKLMYAILERASKCGCIQYDGAYLKMWSDAPHAGCTYITTRGEHAYTRSKILDPSICRWRIRPWRKKTYIQHFNRTFLTVFGAHEACANGWPATLWRRLLAVNLGTQRLLFFTSGSRFASRTSNLRFVERPPPNPVVSRHHSWPSLLQLRRLSLPTHADLNTSAY